MRGWLRHQAMVLLTAWMYFTRVPLPAFLVRRLPHSQQSLEKSIRWLPLFGMLVGLVAGLVFLGANAALGNKPLAILLSMIASIALTGALHEDGWADFFDGFAGGWWSKERILEIMKDSRLGTFGTLALILILAVKYQALLAIDSHQIVAALIAGHAFSRFAAGSFFFTSVYARTNDQSYTKPMPKDKMSVPDFCILAALGAAPLALLGSAWYLLLIPFLWGVRLLFGRWFIGKINGYTGDCLGATQQIVEVCFYLGFIVIARWLA